MVISKKKGLHFGFISDFPIPLSNSRYSLKKKKSLRLNLISDFPILLPKSRSFLKKKEGFHLKSISIFPTFRPNFIITSKKHLQQIETVCAIFKGVPKIEGVPQKKGGPRQLLHSPHPISTTVRTCRFWSIKR